jgi:Icc-related predicted phosphoesterase
MPTVRIAALGDLHVRDAPSEEFRRLFAHLSEKADVLVLCGDLTDRGLIREAEALVEALAACRIPVVGVLGNHDYESGQQEEIARILGRSGMAVLDGETFEAHGVGFAGVKGFGGGFDKCMLQPWGEQIIKQFVQEAVGEAMRLESALVRLRSEQRTRRNIAVLHYAPIHRTVEGEPMEIIPFLGSSRLVDPIERFEVAAVFHAHAHYGSLEGATPRGTPVYNVSLPMLRRAHDEQSYVLIEV